MNSGLPGDLSWTKFYVPTPRPDMLPRPRLMARLEEGLAQSLTLICAPAGYGKTTLLSYWLSQKRLPATWLSLDKQDNDPVRFWAYVIIALQTLFPHLGQAPLDTLQSPQPPPLMSVLPGLLAEIDKQQAPLILILDDYQFISERAVHETLAFCLDHLPPPMHLVMVTRADPPFPLARFRVRNQLNELRATDLRFTRDEAAAFVHRMTDVTLSPEDMTALESRTEGWIAALQLAALSMKGRADIAGFVRAFAGSHVYIAEYLVEEVLQHQSEDVQTFLLHTAILERLNAKLCEAVTGCQDGQAILTAFQRANLFLIPLDDNTEWFRYHHLFADLLRARMRQALPADAIAVLHGRAAAWYEQQGFIVEAIAHALDGKAYERAASLVEQQARTMMFTGRVNTLKNWLGALPEAAFHTHARLTIYRIWIDVMQGKADLSEPALQTTDEMLQALPPSPENEKLRVEWMVISCRFVALSGNTSRAIRVAQDALNALTESDLASHARVHSALTIAYGLEGDIERAWHAYRECLRLALAAGYYSLASHTTMMFAMGMSQQYGQLREAARLYQSIIDMGTQAGQTVFFPAGQGYIGLAEIHVEWNEFETAEGYLAQGMALCSQAGLVGLSTGYVIESRLRQARGDFEGAFQPLYLIEQVAPRGDYTGMIRQIQLRLATGDVEGAARWAGPLMQILSGDLTATRIPLLVLEVFETTVARVFLAQEEIDKAMQLLDQLQATAGPGKRLSRLIDIYLLRALALQKLNEGNITPAALDFVEQALDLAEHEGYILLFVEEGQAMISLLKAVVNQPTTDNRLKTYAWTLLNAFPGNNRPRVSGSPATANLIELLTSRELEVLQLIAAGDSNQTIADKLVITVSAVKKHTSNIFGKLNVSSRTQAIARAHQLGFLLPHSYQDCDQT